MKQCKLCGVELNESNSIKQKRATGNVYIRPYCRKCNYDLNKDKILANNKKRAQKNKTYINAYMKEYNVEYVKNNKEKISERQKLWRNKNTNYQKVYAKKKKDEDPDYYSSRIKIWQDNNKDKVKQLADNWRENNKDKISEYHKERRRKHRWVSVYTNLILRYKEIKGKYKSMEYELITVEDIKSIMKSQKNKCIVTKTKFDLKEYKPYQIYADHIIPLAIGGSHTKNNIQLLTKQGHIIKTRQDKLLIKSLST